MTTDFVRLKNFGLDVFIGIDQRELGKTQPLLVSVKAGLNPKKGYFVDDLQNSAFDYSELPKRFRKFVGSRHFGLIEKLAEDFAAIGLIEFGLPWIEVKVDKQAKLKDVESVSVTIRRSQERDYKQSAFYLLLGSNKKPKDSLSRAVQLLEQDTTVLKIGEIFTTAPHGMEYEHQKEYWNQALKVAAPLDYSTFKMNLLKMEKQISEEVGIPVKTPDFRLIDIDLIFCGDQIAEFEYAKSSTLSVNQSVPSSEAKDWSQNHIFVCMANLEPHFIHPTLKKSMAELAEL